MPFPIILGCRCPLLRDDYVGSRRGTRRCQKTRRPGSYAPHCTSSSSRLCGVPSTAGQSNWTQSTQCRVSWLLLFLQNKHAKWMDRVPCALHARLLGCLFCFTEPGRRLCLATRRRSSPTSVVNSLCCGPTSCGVSSAGSLPSACRRRRLGASTPPLTSPNRRESWLASWPGSRDSPSRGTPTACTASTSASHRSLVSSQLITRPNSGTFYRSVVIDRQICTPLLIMIYNGKKYATTGLKKPHI